MQALTPPTPPARRRSRLALIAPALLCGALALGLPGCGSSHSDGTEADPATAVPASAPVYLGVTVRPSGSLRTGTLEAARAFGSGEASFAKLAELLRTPGSPAIVYKRDLAPWLGPHAGLFLQSAASVEAFALPLLEALGHGGAVALPAGKLDGAIVMDTTDAAAARSFRARQAKHAGAHARSYRGVSYEVGGNVAFGLVGRFAVIGSEPGMRAVIGATQGEAKLASSGAYSKLASAAPGGALGHLYVDAGNGPAASSPGGGLLGVLGSGRPLDLSLVATGRALSVDVDSLARSGSSPGLLSADPEGAAALGELPGNSWLAIGLGHAGANLPADVAGLEAVGRLLGGSGEGAATTLSLGSVLSGLIKPLSILAAPGAAAQRDYRSWMGSAGVFAAGSSILELQGAVAISSKDPARSRAAVGKLGAALRHAGVQVTHASIAGSEAAIGARLPGLPLELDVAAGPGASGSKFVLGLGPTSVQSALSPSETLAGAPSRNAAAATLGEGIAPSLSGDFPTLLTLLESVGLTEDPSLKSVLPYLRATTTLAGGGRSLGGELERVKLVLGLKQTGG